MFCSCWQERSPGPAHDPARTRIAQLSDTARQLAENGDTPSALDYHKKALQESRAARHPDHEARALVDMARIFSTANAEHGLRHFYDALEIADSIGHHGLKADIYLGIAELHKQQENYEEALQAMESHIRLFDTLLMKQKESENEKARIEKRQVWERSIGIFASLLILSIAIIFGIYWLQTRKLNRRLQESLRVRDQLFSILGHDLRGPVGNLVQGLSLLGARVLSKEDEEQMLQLLTRQTNTLNDMLDSLLRWAKTQLDGVGTDPRSFDAVPVINRTLDLLEGLVHQKRLEVVRKLPTSLRIRADADQFDFIIRNLMSNAVKFSKPGGKIEISGEQQGKEVIFTVRDQGVGISADKQQLFHTRNMPSTTGTAGEKGAGLGLLLVKDFLVANNGRIWLESEEGKGTSFSIAVSRV